MARMLVVCWVAAALWTPRVAAQPAPRGVIMGRVLSSRAIPIQGALVRIIDRHVMETSHADGRFVIELGQPGSIRLDVSAIGYRATAVAVTVVPGDTARVEVRLEESVFQLDEIVTTGTVGPVSRQDALSPTSVVSGALLDRSLDGTVASSLRHEPGVTTSGITPGTAQPVIRGLSGDRVVILQDGLRPGDLSATSADHAVSLDPLTAQRIEVVRGPMSLLYGSSALGGVVNLIRDEVPTARPDAIHGVVSAQLSSVNRGATVGGSASGGFGRFAARVEGTVRGAGDTRTPIGRLVNTGLTTVDVAGGVSYVGDRGHAGVSYRFYDSDYGIPGGFVGGHPTGVDIAMQRHSIRSSGELHADSGRWESLRADVGVTFYQHTEFEPSGAVGTAFDQAFTTAKVTARHRGLLGASGGAIGVSGQLRSIETGGTLRTPSTSDYSAAVFAIQEYGSGPLRIQAGIRFDVAAYRPDDGTISVGAEQVATEPRELGAFSGSLGALLDLGGGLKLGASVARAHRTPDFNELYSNGPHLAANSYDVGDPRLTNETGLGFDGFVRLDRERIRAELAVFRNQLDDYIFPSSRGRAVIGRQGGRPLFQYTNEGARFTGIEGTIGVMLVPRLALEATGSYVAARFTGPRAPIPVISDDLTDTTFVAASAYLPLIPPAFGTVELRYETPKYFAGGGIRWSARQDRLGDFESVTDGYVVGDLHAGLRLLLWGQLHTLTLRIDNLADAVYRDHLSRIKEIEPQPGRNISLLYRVAF